MACSIYLLIASRRAVLYCAHRAILKMLLPSSLVASSPGRALVLVPLRPSSDSSLWSIKACLFDFTCEAVGADSTAHMERSLKILLQSLLMLPSLPPRKDTLTGPTAAVTTRCSKKAQRVPRRFLKRGLREHRISRGVLPSLSPAASVSTEAAPIASPFFPPRPSGARDQDERPSTTF